MPRGVRAHGPPSEYCAPRGPSLTSPPKRRPRDESLRGAGAALPRGAPRRLMGARDRPARQVNGVGLEPRRTGRVEDDAGHPRSRPASRRLQPSARTSSTKIGPASRHRAGRRSTSSPPRTASRFGARSPLRASPAPQRRPEAHRSSSQPPPANTPGSVRVGATGTVPRDVPPGASYVPTQGTRRNTSSTVVPSAAESPSASRFSTCSTPIPFSSGMTGAPTTTIRATSSARSNT